MTRTPAPPPSGPPCPSWSIEPRQGCPFDRIANGSRKPTTDRRASPSRDLTLLGLQSGLLGALGCSPPCSREWPCCKWGKPPPQGHFPFEEPEPQVEGGVSHPAGPLSWVLASL